MGNNTLKSTRLKGGIVIWVVAIILLTVGMIASDQWIDLTKWIFGTYALSEVGAKSASAYKSGFKE